MNKVCQPTRNVCRYGYDYHCNDNKTGATCNATVGSKQGAPQVLPLPCVSTAFVAKTLPLPCAPQVPYFTAAQYLKQSTTGLMHNATTESAWFDCECSDVRHCAVLPLLSPCSIRHTFPPLALLVSDLALGAMLQTPVSSNLTRPRQTAKARGGTKSISTPTRRSSPNSRPSRKQAHAAQVRERDTAFPCDSAAIFPLKD